MADLNRQMAKVVSQKVDYVTVPLGANDACTPSVSTMTSVAAFRRSLDTALGTLSTSLPDAKVGLISVPNIYRLWSVAHTNRAAASTWNAFKICQSMLDVPTSTAQADVQRRARVLQRVVDFNTQLAQACVAYGSNCADDGDAVFDDQFTLSQISAWDYFHPNTSGQAALASVSFPNAFGW